MKKPPKYVLREILESRLDEVFSPDSKSTFSDHRNYVDAKLKLYLSEDDPEFSIYSDRLTNALSLLSNL